MKEKKIAKIAVNKSGTGSSTFRVTVPTKWVRQMGLSESVRDLELEFDGETLVVRNLKKSGRDINMGKYVINFGTGIVETINGTLDDAKKTAYEGMAYTQENVSILDCDGEVISVSRWCGFPLEEDDEALCIFGDFGFYQIWSDELE